jgi:hypothetical protein
MQKSKCKTGKRRAATLAPIPGFDFCILRFDFLSLLSAKPRHKVFAAQTDDGLTPRHQLAFRLKDQGKHHGGHGDHGGNKAKIKPFDCSTAAEAAPG